jgi:hypothetical protein
MEFFKNRSKVTIPFYRLLIEIEEEDNNNKYMLLWLIGYGLMNCKRNYFDSVITNNNNFSVYYNLHHL